MAKPVINNQITEPTTPPIMPIAAPRLNCFSIALLSADEDTEFKELSLYVLTDYLTIILLEALERIAT